MSGFLFGDGDGVDDFDAEPFEPDDFAGVIGEEADGVEVEIGEDLGSDACIVLEHALALSLGGEERIAAMREDARFAIVFLHAHARSGLVEIDEDARAGCADLLHGALQDLMAVAVEGAKDIAIGAV